VFNEIAAESMTAIARSLVRYDLSQGQFVQVVPDVWSRDISAMCLDEERGRRMYLGFVDGTVVLMNYMNGEFIDTIEAHPDAKEVTAIASYQKNGRNRLYVGSADGRVRTYDESGGSLNFNATTEESIGKGVGVADIKVAPSVKALVMFGNNSCYWGVWSETVLKNIIFLKEKDIITAIQVTIRSTHLSCRKAFCV
jgi:WD40 repeat protein